jgi:hypothetical protein
VNRKLYEEVFVANKFEEYKLFVEDTARFSDRRQQISVTYLTVNSIIIGAIAFLVKDAKFVEVWRGIVVILILGVGVFSCVLWKQLINKYKLIVDFRIDELRAIEEHTNMKDCHKMFHAEDKLYPRDAEGKPIKGEALNISDKEKWLPNVFMGIYTVFFLGQLIYLVTGIGK